MTTPKPHRRWYHLTPDRFFAGVLVVQVFLLLSDYFQWFALSEKKGWTVLIAVGVVGLAVLVMLAWGLVCLCLPRRFQFSFRSLLVFMVAVSVSFGWFAWEMQKARRQREAVEAIVGLGGEASYGPQARKSVGVDIFSDVVKVEFWHPLDEHMIPGGAPVKPVTDEFVRNHIVRLSNLRHLSLAKTQITDAGLAHLTQLAELRTLWLNDTQVSSGGLAHLKGMSRLWALNLSGTDVTDAGLDHLKGLAELELLTLNDTQITDAGLKQVTGLTDLQCLSLGRCQVTDVGLGYLEGSTSLEILNLDETLITDAGLKHLHGLVSLRSLSLRGTKVTDTGLEDVERLSSLGCLYVKNTQLTDEGVKKLQQALPDCEIIRY